MKMLYVSSCHPTLEYNDLTLFTQMGVECVSTGVYSNPQKPIPQLTWRGPIIDMKFNQDVIALLNSDNPSYHSSLVGYNRPHLNLSKELVSSFDVIICNSFPHYIEDNWQALKGKNVIWRTYGDSTPDEERRMQSKVKEGLRIVRGTGNELKKPNCAGGEVISCHVDQNWFNGWSGSRNSVLSFQNAFHIRHLEQQGRAYLNLREATSAKFSLFGDHPQLHPMVQKFLTPQEQLQEYRENQVYFSIGSHPAPITFNFMEAMMTGIPVVTFDYKVGGSSKDGKPSYYQVPEFIDHGVTGFVSDDSSELRAIIEELLDNKTLREEISEEGRKSAIEMWGLESVKEKWKDFLNQEVTSV